MRRVRDEGAPGVVEAGEPCAHPVERPRELAELVAAVIHDGVREIAAGDPVRSALEPLDPARKDRRGAEPQEDRGDEGDQAGCDQPPLDEVHVRESVVERRRQEQHAPVRPHRHRGLGEPLIAALDGSTPRGERRRRGERDRIVLHVRRVPSLQRVGEDVQRPRRLGERGKEDDARVRAHRGVRDEVDRRQVGLGELRPETGSRAPKLRDLSVHESALERRHERDVDDRKRSRHDDRECEAEARADAPERIHAVSGRGSGSRLRARSR